MAEDAQVLHIAQLAQTVLVADIAVVAEPVESVEVDLPEINHLHIDHSRRKAKLKNQENQILTFQKKGNQTKLHQFLLMK